jgi:aminocarboxymuconate-semialdehyde decarboxylase
MDRPTMYRLTRIANDSIADLAAKHADRFIGVGVLPAVDDVLIAEFCRLTDELGLPGVVIFSHVDGKPLDDASMWPLYAEASRRNAAIWIHPQHGHSYPWLQENMLDRLFGWPFETTLAMARLVYGGVLERYPQLTFVTHHLGGMVPYYANRIDSMDHVAGNGLSRPARDYFRLFYSDTMVHGNMAALTCGLEFFGAGHMMFGTDFPMGPQDGEKGPVQVLDSVRQLNVSEVDRQLILGGNLLRILQRA